MQVVEVKMPLCGHVVAAKCGEAAALRADPTLCKAKCGVLLPCNDPCTATCGACTAKALNEEPALSADGRLKRARPHQS